MFVVTVDVAKCEACGDCIDSCPQELLVLVEEEGKKYAMFKGAPEECSACDACESSGNEGAVTVTEL